MDKREMKRKLKRLIPNFLIGFGPPFLRLFIYLDERGRRIFNDQ
jgi:hypothetical protein